MLPRGLPGRISLLVLLLTASLGGAIAAHAQVPPPTVHRQAQFPIRVSDSDAALVNVVLDFTPGAGAPDHTHGGPVIALVLNGEMVLREHGMVKTYRAGEFWTELPGQIHNASNESDAAARVSVVSLVPKGGRLTMPEAQSSYTPAASPTTAFQAQFPLGVAAGEAVLVNVVLDFAPHSGTAEHIHGGPVLATVLEGEITLHEHGTTRVIKAGESWTEMPHNIHRASNEGASAARVSVAAILPAGAPLSGPPPQRTLPATLPQTGTASDLKTVWLAISGAALVCAGGWLMRRKRRPSS